MYNLPDITRTIIKAATCLHTKALYRRVAQFDRASERAGRRHEDQRSVVRWAQSELALRKAAWTTAVYTADVEARKAAQEGASLPRF